MLARVLPAVRRRQGNSAPLSLKTIPTSPLTVQVFSSTGDRVSTARCDIRPTGNGRLPAPAAATIRPCRSISRYSGAEVTVSVSSVLVKRGVAAVTGNCKRRGVVSLLGSREAFDSRHVGETVGPDRLDCVGYRSIKVFLGIAALGVRLHAGTCSDSPVSSRNRGRERKRDRIGRRSSPGSPASPMRPAWQQTQRRQVERRRT